MNITIFGLQAGKDGQNTLLFQNCTNVITGEDSIQFDYASVSTGAVRHGVFYLDRISGYATDVE